MIEKRYIELINGEIDGVNTPEESSELRRYFDTHPEAQRYYDELKELGRTFSEMNDLDPPGELREAILASVASRSRKPKRESYLARIREWLAPPARPRYALAFVTGVLVGFCVFAVSSVVMLRGTDGQIDRLYGTLATEGDAASILSSECIPFDLPELYGGACIEHSTAVVQANLDLSSEEEIHVVFEYDDLLEFEGLRALDESEHTMHVEGNRAELTHLGECDYVLVFRDGRSSGSPIHLSVTAEDGLIFEKSIVPGGE
jgi:hypothetical protein